MTKEERVRVGRKLRAMRIERGLDQIEVAADPRVAMSVGTLQAIEGAWYDVRDQNIEKYAHFFGTSLTELLRTEPHHKAVHAADPLLKDLNDEHLEIARNYMRARKRVRAAVEVLLAQPTEQLSVIVTKLETLSTDRLDQIEEMLAVDDRTASLLDRVRQRIHADPEFAGLIAESMAALSPTKPNHHHRPQKKSPKRA